MGPEMSGAAFSGRWVSTENATAVHTLSISKAKGRLDVRSSSTSTTSATVESGRVSLDGLIGTPLVHGMPLLHWSNGLAWARTGVSFQGDRVGLPWMSGQWVEVMRHAGSGEYPEGQG